jgi:hypothetical protein
MVSVQNLLFEWKGLSSGIFMPNDPVHKAIRGACSSASNLLREASKDVHSHSISFYATQLHQDAEQATRLLLAPPSLPLHPPPPPPSFASLPLPFSVLPPASIPPPLATTMPPPPAPVPAQTLEDSNVVFENETEKKLEDLSKAVSDAVAAVQELNASVFDAPPSTSQFSGDALASTAEPSLNGPILNASSSVAQTVRDLLLAAKDAQKLRVEKAKTSEKYHVVSFKPSPFCSLLETTKK